MAWVSRLWVWVVVGLCLCVCVLFGVLLASVMSCGFLTSDWDQRGSLGCGGFVCVCLVFCSPFYDLEEEGSGWAFFFFLRVVDFGCHSGG